jgi:hypothetical protein
MVCKLQKAPFVGFIQGRPTGFACLLRVLFCNICEPRIESAANAVAGFRGRIFDEQAVQAFYSDEKKSAAKDYTCGSRDPH